MKCYLAAIKWQHSGIIQVRADECQLSFTLNLRKLNLSSAVSDVMLMGHPCVWFTGQDRQQGPYFSGPHSSSSTDGLQGREWCLQSIQTNGEVPPSSNFSCPPLLIFPTPPPKGIPIRLGRCPSHLGLTGKEVGTSGEKEDRIHGGKKTRGGGEWLSWNTGAGVYTGWWAPQ